MTCVVGLVADEGVFIGGDSAGSDGDSITARADEKVFARDGMAFGFTWSYRMGQLLRYRLSVPMLPEPDRDLMEYMVTEFVEAVRACLSDGGVLKKLDEVESAGEFLVGLRGRLFCIDSDFQVAESTDAYECVGNGAAVARGAMHATEADAFGPLSRVGRALEAAAHHVPSVRGPFHVVSAS